MHEVLQKDESAKLPDQISRIIRTRIEAGEYRPGKRLGSIRQFAREFSVCPVTVIRALDILKEESLIERIPAKGVFVSERLNSEKKPLTACFVFPEKEMVQQENAKENWGLNYELYRGLFDGSRQHKINLQFIYFEDHPDRALLAQQKAALRKFDFAIFPNDTQLTDLREASAGERLTFYLASYFYSQSSPSQAVKVDYDRNAAEKSLLDYYLETGCRSAAAAAWDTNRYTRGTDFLSRIASETGTDRTELWTISRKYPDSLKQIKKYLKRKAEFIFVDSTESMPLIFEAAFDLGLLPGKDFIITAIASGMTFSGLFPRFSFFRIPRYEMALQIMRSADEIIRRGGKTGTIPELKVEFIEAQKNNYVKGKVSA